MKRMAPGAIRQIASEVRELAPAVGDRLDAIAAFAALAEGGQKGAVSLTTAAQALGVSEATLRRWIAGRLIAASQGPDPLVPVSEITRLRDYAVDRARMSVLDEVS